MKTFLSCDDLEWEIGWGLTLIGTQSDCAVRLPEGPTIPPVAGALFRWMDRCVVMGIGDPPGLWLPGRTAGEAQQPIRYLTLSGQRLRDLAADRVLVHELLVGGRRLRLTWQDVATRVAPDRVDRAFLHDVLMTSLRLGQDTRQGRDPGAATAGTLRLLGMLTDARNVRSVPDAPAASAGSLQIRSMTQAFPMLSCQLDFDGDAPPREYLDAVGRELASELQELVTDQARAARRQPDPPSYRQITLKLPHLDVPVWAHHLLDPDDFSHLKLPPGTVRDPQCLVTTLGGLVEMLDLSDPPRLVVNGKTVRRAAVAQTDSIQLCGVAVKIDPTAATTINTEVSARVFRSLGLPADPVSLMVRLGLVLPQLSTGTDRRAACLLAAASSAGADGIVVGQWRARVGMPEAPGATPEVIWSQGLVRQRSREVSPGLLIGGQLLGAVVDAACKNPGRTLQIDDAHTDLRLFPTERVVVADRVMPAWGPVIVMAPADRPVMVAWRYRDQRPFVARELAALQTLLAFLEEEGLIEPHGRASQVAGIEVPPVSTEGRLLTGAAPGWLSSGRIWIPLDPVTLVGRDPSCEVTIDVDLTVSAQHLLMVQEGGQMRIFDFRSRNGVRVNGKRVEEAVLNDGDEIVVGEFAMRFHSTGPRGESSQDPSFGPRRLQLGGACEIDQRRLTLIGQALALGAAPPGDDANMTALVATFGIAAAGADHGAIVSLRPDGDGLVVHSAVGDPPDQWPEGLVEAVSKSTVPDAPPWTRKALAGAPRPQSLIVMSLVALAHKVGAPTGLVLRCEGHGPADVDLNSLAAVLSAALPDATSPRETPLVDAPGPRLVRSDGRAIEVAGVMWIGRSPECDVVLEDSQSSRRHALLVPVQGAGSDAVIVDFRSGNGLYINGRATRRGLLTDGTRLRIGTTEFTYRGPEGSARPQGAYRLCPTAMDLGRQLQGLNLDDRPAVDLLLNRVVEILGLHSLEVLDGTLVEEVKVKGQSRAAVDVSGWERAKPLTECELFSIRALSPSELYRHTNASIMLDASMVVRSCVHMKSRLTTGGVPRLRLVASSLQGAEVAFDHDDLALLAAVLETLARRCAFPESPVDLAGAP